METRPHKTETMIPRVLAAYHTLHKRQSASNITGNDDNAAQSIVWKKEIQTEQICLAISALVVAFALFFVVGRLYVRMKILQRVFLYDWFILVGMIMGIFAFIAWAISDGSEIASNKLKLHNINHNFTQIEEQTNERYWKMTTLGYTLSIIFSILEATFARLSILYTFSRLSISSDRRTIIVRRLINTVAVVITIISIPMIWLSVDPCWPPNPQHLLDSEGTSGSKCLMTNDNVPFTMHMFFISSVINAIVDVFTFACPFIIFRWSGLGTEMGKGRKYGLYGLFSFGFVVFLVSIARAAFMGYVIGWLWEHGDGVEAETVPMVLGSLEANCVVIGAALPVLARPVMLPLWRRITGKASELKPSTTARSNSQVVEIISLQRSKDVESVEESVVKTNSAM